MKMSLLKVLICCKHDSRNYAKRQITTVSTILAKRKLFLCLNQPMNL